MEKGILRDFARRSSRLHILVSEMCLEAERWYGLASSCRKEDLVDILPWDGEAAEDQGWSASCFMVTSISEPSNPSSVSSSSSSSSVKGLPTADVQDEEEVDEEEYEEASEAQGEAGLRLKARERPESESASPGPSRRRKRGKVKKQIGERRQRVWSQTVPLGRRGETGRCRVTWTEVSIKARKVVGMGRIPVQDSQQVLPVELQLQGRVTSGGGMGRRGLHAWWLTLQISPYPTSIMQLRDK
ncbi:hypothetical protein EYF80_019213 [Liparis tanakae]|uniref:Uncharacterized protein n=1 Tax=Liparis tanakae TaxID=230148 RepID=A0A4Z2HXR2_9TELE|nr:hypothetical protein EYF80_019213 [Liparis tanakae]